MRSSSDSWIRIRRPTRTKVTFDSRIQRLTQEGLIRRAAANSEMLSSFSVMLRKASPKSTQMPRLVTQRDLLPVKKSMEFLTT